jgi:hypothetical protein
MASVDTRGVGDNVCPTNNRFGPRECKVANCKEKWWWSPSDCLLRSVVQCNTRLKKGNTGDMDKA